MTDYRLDPPDDPYWQLDDLDKTGLEALLSQVISDSEDCRTHKECQKLHELEREIRFRLVTPK